MAQIQTFLGANTPFGFFSLFDELYNPYKSCRSYLIKGGPGTGKSTLMKKIAAVAREKGLDTELVYCSSDPNSLDGVIIPELSFCIADATAPHVVEPNFPGACENIVNMGAFWNEKKLFEKGDEIRALTVENSMYHRRSALFLSSAGSVLEDSQRILVEAADNEKISSFAARFAARETPKKKNCAPGKKKRRFISAITPNGLVFLSDTITTLASRVIGIEDEYGAASGIVTQRIGEFAVKNGYNVIFCLCPMKPKDYCEHIIIPEVGLCVMTVKSAHKTAITPNRIVHAERFVNRDLLHAHRNRLAFNKKVANELIGESIDFLKKAKDVHDKLEKCYIDAMDYEQIDLFTKEFIEEKL